MTLENYVADWSAWVFNKGIYQFYGIIPGSTENHVSVSSLTPIYTVYLKIEPKNFYALKKQGCEYYK